MGHVILSEAVPLMTVPVPPPYLTFSSPSAFSISVASPGWDGTMEYSTDKSTWKTWDGSEIAAVDNRGTYALYVRGAGNTKVAGGDSAEWSLTGTNISCDGNIESLQDYATVVAGGHPQMAPACYGGLFMGCSGLITAPELPSAELSAACYGMMFANCTNLTTAPSLPATTLAQSCYQQMFEGCTNLTTAPELPATTLASNGYFYMFNKCTSLTTPPALPATTLVYGCYKHMFDGCTSLIAVPALPATTLTDSCYYYMFRGCTSLKLSVTQTGNYTRAYRIPTSGTGTTATNALTDMFTTTGGTFTGTPDINTTYYLDTGNIIV